MDDGPCWGAWLSTWDGVRDDLRRDLRDAREAFALAERLNEDTSANPRATADQRRSAAFDLKRARTQVRKNRVTDTIRSTQPPISLVRSLVAIDAVVMARRTRPRRVVV